MGYWGWRPLVAAFMCVWVAGCDLTGEPAPVAYASQTTLEITLTAGNTGDRASPSPGLSAIPTRAADTSASPATATQTVYSGATRPFNRITPTPVGLVLDPPVCTPSPGGLMCLGLVHNPLPTAVERIMLRAVLSGPDGGTTTSVLLTTALTHLPAGGQSPYRAIFAGAIPADHTVLVSSVSADTAVVGRPQATVAETGFSISGTRVSMRTRITNDTDASIQLTRAVFMLIGPQDVLEGYVVAPLEAVIVEPGRSYDVSATLLLSGARDIDPDTLNLSVLVETALLGAR